MLTLNDKLEKDILAVLLYVPKARLQRKQIRDQLSAHYGKKYSKGSFDVVLQRRLDRLRAENLVKREYVERKALYFIPDETKNKVKKLLMKDKAKEELSEWIDKLDLVNMETWLSSLKGFLDFLVECKEGEEFWLWLPDMDHPEKIKKFKYVGTKILRQD